MTHSFVSSIFLDFYRLLSIFNGQFLAFSNSILAKNSMSVTKTKAVLKQKMATQSIDWQSNNVVLVHCIDKGGIIELQRVTQLSTATEANREQ